MQIVIVFFIANLIIIGIYAKKDCKLRLQRCESKKPPLRKQVCGTDNQTYPNRCALLRVQCAQNSPLTVKHTGKCREKQPCWMDQNKKMTKNSDINSRTNADYIPECLADGTYAPVQCHMGYCWCVTSNGRMILGTSVRHRRLECPKRGKMNDPEDDFGNSAKTGCDEINRSAFIKNLVRIFKTEYNRRDTRGIHYNIPENRNVTSLDLKAVEWKFAVLDIDRNDSLNKNEYKDLRALVRKVVKPKKCSRKFIRMCDVDRNMIITRQEWINCFNDSTIEEDEKRSPDDSSEESDTESEDVDPAEPERDPTGDLLSGGPLPLYDHPVEDSEKELESKVNDCFADRKSVLDEVKMGNQLTYTPECTPDGRYKKVQCFPSTGYCWCVMEDSGKPIPGTSVKFDTPKCDVIRNLPPSITDCPDHKRILFVRNLMDFFHHNLSNTNIEGDEAGVKDGKDSHEQTATRGFYSLDSNKNKILDKKEWKLFRSMVSTMNKTLKKCGRKFLRHCDSNLDNKVNLSEWLQCVNVQNINVHDIGTNGEHQKPQRRGPNPELFLKSED